MEYKQANQQETVDQIYQHAANLLVQHKKEGYEVRNELIARGLDAESASVVVENLERQIEEARRSRANKDMIYGALWLVGGLIGTFSNTGFIFWGAIVFGGIQFFKGLISATSN